MKRTAQGSALPPDQEPQTSPWHGVDESGTHLSVEDFLTTQVNQTSNALRRAITLPYADQFGLSMSEWRILSVLAHARQLPFAKLVAQSATDKAQVSRTLRLLESRGLVDIQTEGPASRGKLTCLITPPGEALYAEVMPIARRRQAQFILQLSPQERNTLYRALSKLRQLCEQPDEAGE